jgi:hypothetical protein
MLLNLYDRIGDWNPQLLRELRSRLNLSNLGIAVAISLVTQLLVSLYCWSQISFAFSPHVKNWSTPPVSSYCTDSGIPNFGYSSYNAYTCLKDAGGNFIINWQSWWETVFFNLGLIEIWLLIVAVTYLLVSDLATEKKNGTLNFIRFSPQSTQSVLIGKMLGVPIALYITVLCALPLHLWAGLAGQIPLGRIVTFYGVLVAGCFLFYSAALLYALVGDWLSGIQPWLFSGIVWAFLWVAAFDATHAQALLSPANTLSTLVDPAGDGASFWQDGKTLPILISLNLKVVHWFYFPVGERLVTLIGLVLFNYAFWTYWIWQALERRFPNPNATLLTKRQSYVLAACFGVLRFGSALDHHRYDSDYDWGDHFFGVLGPSLGQLCLFLFLIVALSPRHQALLDWARYRQQRLTRGKGFWNGALIHDLLWGEKSPALVTIALNLLITVPCIVPWILSWPDSHFRHIKQEVFLALPVEAGLILIFAAVAQLTILAPTRRPAFSNLSIPGAIILWIAIALFLGGWFGIFSGMSFRTGPEFNLSSIIFCIILMVVALIAQLGIRTSARNFKPSMLGVPGIAILGITLAFSLGKFGIQFFFLSLLLCELCVLGLLSCQLTRQLQQAGSRK